MTFQRLKDYTFFKIRGGNLENEVILMQFEEIEVKIEKLLQLNKSLENANADLRGQ